MAKMVRILLSERVLVTYKALLSTSVSLKNSWRPNWVWTLSRSWPTCELAIIGNF
jgi:hypothetical protein